MVIEQVEPDINSVQGSIKPPGSRRKSARNCPLAEEPMAKKMAMRTLTAATTRVSNLRVY